MDEKDKLRDIRRRLEEIAAEAVKLSQSIERIRKELERIGPPPTNGDKN
jgi:hypothetical protein